jgi:Domain of unknown function (DUF4136)
MPRLGSVTAATLAVLALTGCATLNVSSHMERRINVAQFHTYDWGPADALPTGDPRLDTNPFFHDYFQGAVDKELTAKGFEQSRSGTPDLLIHYHANVTRRFSVAGVENEYGPCTTESCQPRLNEYEAGTLVIDVVDTRTNRVIWRGWAQQRVDRLLADQESMREHVTESVMRMMARFPRPPH